MREDKKNLKSLKTLIIASFLGEGDIYLHSRKTKIFFSFDISKTSFIKNFIMINNLEPYVEIDITKQQFIIQDHEILLECYPKWYNDQKKIYHDKMVTYEAIMLSLILFGKRKLEFLEMETTIDKKYIPTLAYGIERYMQIPIVAGHNCIKLYDTGSLLINALQKLGLNECTELAHFLTKKEKDLLTSNVNSLCEGEAQYEFS